MRLRMQFSLRVLALVIALFALALGGWVRCKHQREKELAAIKTVINPYDVHTEPYFLGSAVSFESQRGMVGRVVMPLTIPRLEGINIAGTLPEAWKSGEIPPLVRENSWVSIKDLPSVDEPILEQLIGHRTRSVSINFSAITPNALRFISDRKQIQWLEIRECGPAELPSLLAIAELPNLVSLDCAVHASDLQKVKSLACSGTLRSLRLDILSEDQDYDDFVNLQENRVSEDAPITLTAAHLQCLVECKQLESIQITGIVDNSAVMLLRKECTSLKKLEYYNTSGRSQSWSRMAGRP
jgi:hypothetical protein